MSQVYEQTVDYQLAGLSPVLQGANSGNTLLESLPVWLSAQTRKSAGRGRSADNTRQYGVQRLRELILELAVRGKLVEQHPNDEPARILLEKIAEEKTRLVKKGKLKKQKPLAPVSSDEQPFNLPYGWEFERLGNAINVINGRAYKRNEMLDSGTPLLRVGNLFTSNEWYYSDLELEPEKYIDTGDLIYAWSASFGPFVWDGGRVIYHYHIWKMDIYRPDLLDKYFTYRFLASVTQTIKASGNGIAMIHMTKERMEKLILPIPPLAEQHRIVKKVDELMALCDQLEQQQADALQAHDTLVKVLLDTLTQSETAEDFQQNWHRIAEHFDTLFTTESSINQLKQTLLQLAVMGKLVPQDPNDEPASILLEKIAKEKARLIKEVKIKKQKPLSDISDEELSFTLPCGWAFSRLNNVIDVRDGTHDSPKSSNADNAFPLVTSKDFCNGQINFETTKLISAADHIEISKRSLVEVDDILFSMIGGNIGNQVIVKDERPFSIKNVALFKYYNKDFTSPYFIKAFMENLAEKLQELASGGAQPFVSLGFLRNLVIALPPINEQHRIVKKVDELMTLCDQLKNRLNQAQTLQKQIADAVVEQTIK